jgi:hypothetical protein
MGFEMNNLTKMIGAFASAIALLSVLTHAAEPRAMSHHTATVESGISSLDVYAEGNRVALLLVERRAGFPPQLQFLGSSDGGRCWGAPVVVGAGQPAPEPAHRGMDAQIAVAGDRLVAIWTSEGKEDRFGRGPMVSAYSSDGGRTWSAGRNPADDRQASGHAFIDIAADQGGTFHTVWLDGRADPQASHGSAASKPSAGKGLRYARSTDGGASWSANQTLVDQTCECCWNTIAAGPHRQLAVLYRAYDPRDMTMITSNDSGITWNRPAAAGAFNWKIDGCPHVGGGLALAPDDPNQIFATVWTGKDDTARGAYFMTSLDAGTNWAAPIQLGDAGSWHTDLARNGNRLAACWDSYADRGTSVFVITSSDLGKTWSAPAQLNRPAALASHPRVIKSISGFRVFWTEKSDDRLAAWKSAEIQ